MSVKVSRRALLGGAAAFSALNAVRVSAGQSSGPNIAPFDISAIPILDEKQAGTVRFLQNVGNQFQSDWANFTPGTEFRELLSYYWPLALAQYHWLPAAPGALYDTSLSLISRMQKPNVWEYWYAMSQSGPHWDDSLKAPRQAWPDPVRTENIMYSGRLGSMIGMHSGLYNDDQFQMADAINLDWDEPYGKGPEKIRYTQDSLAQRIYWQMVESGYLGIACEPNLVFPTCQNWAIFALRFNDLRKGTSQAEEVTRSYKDAWERKTFSDGQAEGLIGKDGYMIALVRAHQDRPVLARSPDWGSFAGTFMNAWYPEFTQELLTTSGYEYAFRHHSDGTISVWPGRAYGEVRAAITNGQDPESAVDYRKARFTSGGEGGTTSTSNTRDHHLMFMSEMGEKNLVDGMLAHLDAYCNPKWENGGLHYPRNEQMFDEHGNLTFMTAWNNASAAFARLNLKDGLRKIYQQPWGPEHFLQPNLAALSRDVQILRAAYLADRRALVLTIRGVDRKRSDAELIIANASTQNGTWKLYRDAAVVATGNGNSISSASLPKVEWRRDTLAIVAPVQEASTFVLIWT